ncbi:MAG: PAS domain S-box protein [Bacteroidota bacterium]
MGLVKHSDKEKFEKIFECSNDAILIVHPDSHFIVDSNPAATRMLGYSKEELLRMPLMMVHPEDIFEYNRFADEVCDCGRGWTDQFCFTTKDGDNISVEISASLIQMGDEHYILEIVRDVSGRFSAEEALKQRIKLEKLVSTVSTEFLQLESDQLDILINNALAEIGKHAKVDRCYVYRKRSPNDKLVCTNEWVSEGIPSMINVQNSKASKNFWWVHQQLYEFKTVHIPDIEKLPNDENAITLRANLASMNIKSTLSVPMHYSDKLIGFLGFDNIRHKKHWHEEDISLLKVIGEVFVNAINRKKADDKLKRVNSKLANLNEQLEQKVFERSEEIIRQNEKLTNYAYYNAHKLRGPLARLLGLVNLVRSEYVSSEELPDVMKKIEDAGLELDDIVKEINKILA